MKIIMGCVTDKGGYRDKNQDRVAGCLKNKKGKSLAVACVCDGIGSFAQSEIAAEMLTGGIARWFQGVEDSFPQNIQEKNLVEDLEATIRELNELVYEYRLRHGIDIGCTMSLMLVVNGSYHIFHVGDSRICRVKDAIYQMTRDEVSVSETDGKVRTKLENYIGESPGLWVNRQTGTVEAGELFLLGSDGLFKKLQFQDVKKLTGKVKNNFQAKRACSRIIRLVIERGEKDNVSCILLSVR